MKTYEKNGYRWYWDFHLKLWTIYPIDSEGNQTAPAYYCRDKKALKKSFPELNIK